MPLIPKNRSNLAMSMIAKQRGLLPKGVLEVHSPYQNCFTLHCKNHFVKDCQGFECYFNNIQSGSSLHSAQLQLIQHWFSQMKLKTKVAGSCHLYCLYSLPSCCSYSHNIYLQKIPSHLPFITDSIAIATSHN